MSSSCRRPGGWFELFGQELGLSYRAIAEKLEVDDKTVAKAVRWLRMTLI